MVEDSRHIVSCNIVFGLSNTIVKNAVSLTNDLENYKIILVLVTD